MEFAVTYDYLCPFACIVNETIVAALRDGAPWKVTFRPFSLVQVHLEEGRPPVWDREPGSPGTRGVRALLWSLAVRERFPDRFLDVHAGLYRLRHGHAGDLDDVSALRGVVAGVGLEPDDIEEVVAGGEPAKILSAEHVEAVERWSVFGVPTILVDEEAVFVRLMERSRADLERLLEMVSWVNLNEFKRTRIPR